ncbi:MAG: hypothetical protein Q4E69_03820 [Bacilli bacterium]|nr:hypothetical protein [Bacilli bacterium]
MKNKIISIIITISLMIFSFIFISKSKEIVKNIDPIMDNINKVKDKYEVKPQDAYIKEDTIIPGVSGKIIDKNISYSKMKKYGAFNESFITIKKEKPNISIDNNYDKYIVSGNKSIKKVSLIFYIEDISDLKIITNYLNTEHLSGTILLNSNLLDSNEEYISTLKQYEIELYLDDLNDINLSQYSNYLYSITNNKNKFCILEEKDKEKLDICRRHNMHTIIPNIVLSNNPTINIKKNISNGSIILINITNDILKELDYIVNYIEGKGYTITSLNRLLVE